MKNVIIALVSFVVLIFTDQITKRFGADPNSISFNQGIIFGLYSDISPTLRIITLSSFGGFLVSLYLLALFFIPMRMLQLKLAISALIAGVISNVIDRIYDGQTIDFIPLPGTHIVFNLADSFQWIGAGFILWNLWRRGGDIWQVDNQRGRYLILPKEQLQFCIKLVAITFGTSILVGVFSFSYLRVILLEIRAENADAILINFGLAFLFLTCLFGVIAFIFGLYISHRSAGPIHAFSLFVDDLTQGKMREFQLRDRDHFKQLEKIALKLQDHFKK